MLTVQEILQNLSLLNDSTIECCIFVFQYFACDKLHILPHSVQFGNFSFARNLGILQSCKMGHEVGGWVGGSLVGNQTPK